MDPGALPHLYRDLASWFHLLTPPGDYAREAAWYRDAIAGVVGRGATLLELGCGGGNNASHLKTDFRCTLTDLSPEMLLQSARINPECEHVQGDMRDLRLGRTFDAVLVHDAVTYLTTEAELRSAMETAYLHCRPGGVALVATDFTRESFVAGTDHGGADGDDGRALRYLEWIWDPDPSDTTYRADIALLLREGGVVRVVQELHVLGLFSRATWDALLDRVGFERLPLPPAEREEVGEVFLVRR